MGPSDGMFKRNGLPEVLEDVLVVYGGQSSDLY